MAKINNSSLDTRSMMEIWASLSEDERLSLRNALIAKFSVSRQTVHNWANGIFRPTLDYVRKGIGKCIDKELGIHCNYKLLFPSALYKRR